MHVNVMLCVSSGVPNTIWYSVFGTPDETLTIVCDILLQYWKITVDITKRESFIAEYNLKKKNSIHFLLHESLPDTKYFSGLLVNKTLEENKWDLWFSRLPLVYHYQG